VLENCFDQRHQIASKDFKRLDLFKKALAQKRNDRDKIYSLHEPHTKCISKGKEHKKYEFGNKASIAKTISGETTVWIPKPPKKINRNT